MTAYPAMYGPMAHHYGNDVSALTPGSTEGSAHGKPVCNYANAMTHPVPPSVSKHSPNSSLSLFVLTQSHEGKLGFEKKFETLH